MLRVVRTTTVSAIVIALMLLGFWRYTVDQKQRAIDELNALKVQLEQQLIARQEMIGRLSRARRMGHVEVLDQKHDSTGAAVETTVRFIELNDDGRELARQDFTIPGNVLFIDAWTVKFEPNDVAHGDPLRGKTLILLRRVYSDRMRPLEGLPIDTPGAIPAGYAASEPAKFEQQIWQDFWRLASDRAAAAALGIRVAQGEAVYQQVAPGQRYELIVDNAGGMSLAAMPLKSDPRAAQASDPLRP